MGVSGTEIARRSSGMSEAHRLVVAYASHRTFATVAMEAGVLEEIVGRLLNHTPLSITGQRYARPSLDALRPAMQTICDALGSRIEGA